MRNINRVGKEMQVYNYKPFSVPFYKLDKNHFRVNKQFNDLITNYHNCLEGSKCNQKLYQKVEKTFFEKYMFINIKD